MGDGNSAVGGKEKLRGAMISTGYEPDESEIRVWEDICTHIMTKDNNIMWSLRKVTWGGMSSCRGIPAE